jgi:hypothetical protein
MKKIGIFLINVVTRIFRGILVQNYEQLIIAIGRQNAMFFQQPNFMATQTRDVGFKVFSQFDEDGIMTYLIEKFQIIRPNILEIGVGNFTECNSRWLVENFNAKCVVVDKNSDLPKNLEKMGYRQKNDILVINTWVDQKSIKEVESASKNFLTKIDVISIDLDGIDYWIAKELDFTNVSIAIVEINPFFGSTESLTIPYKKDFERRKAHHSQLYFGASIGAYIKLFRNFGMTFIGFNSAANNAFFVKNSLLEFIKQFELPSAENIAYALENYSYKESLGLDGQKTYLNMQEGRKLIRDLPTIEV